RFSLGTDLASRISATDKQNNYTDSDCLDSSGKMIAICGSYGIATLDFFNAEVLPEVRSRFSGDEIETFEFKKSNITSHESMPVPPDLSIATFTGIDKLLATIFAQSPIAKERGLGEEFFINPKSARSKGKCHSCLGYSFTENEVSSFETLRVSCSACGGSGFSSEVREAKVHGLNIAEYYHMEIGEVAKELNAYKKVSLALTPYMSVGLGHLKLFFILNEISSGELQRASMIRHFSKANKRSLLFYFEPTRNLDLSCQKRVCSAINSYLVAGRSLLFCDNSKFVISKANWVIEVGNSSTREIAITFSGDSKHYLARTCK
ncbi:MAG: hypothetical protein KDD53_10830, partial [Bdellovibrionales bacterium]|nr:hypothetical protein [Bdellovibrionales bacterium]